MDISHLLTPYVAKMETSLVRELLRYSQQSDMLSLAGGLPDETMMPAYPDIKGLTDSRQYGASEGEPKLREVILSMVSDLGLRVSVDDILVTHGSQQGLDIISRLILDENSTILTEQPTYLAACQVFNLQGANIKGVASDQEGMSLSALRDAIEVTNPKAVYLIPNFQNPTGHCYSLKRRQEIADLLDEKNILLIEDDPYRALCYEEVDLTPISSLLNVAPWLYMGSFSKVLWPGLRTGYIASCCALSSHLVKVKQAIDLHTNRLSQMIIASFVESDAYPEHLIALRNSYKEKRDVMAKALVEKLNGIVKFSIPAGGMFFWLQLPENVSSQQVLAKALEQKVLVLPGVPFFPNENLLNDSYLRLSFARVSSSEVEKSITILAEIIKRLSL